MLLRFSGFIVSGFLCSIPWASVQAMVVGPRTDLVVENKMISPDGFDRLAVVAGGSMPGPLIRGVKGFRFKLNVIDKLTDEDMLTSTSIHWHGILQRGTNWADGPTFINQCPITTGHSFLYDFCGGDQTGSFWYHSHHVVQYCDGLRGPVVIYDPEDPYKNMYDVDDESTIITLMDWYHVPANQVPPGPGPDSNLINGLGRFQGGPQSPLAVVTVECGKRYRMRLMNMGCDPNYVFSIDGHTNLTFIEADGVLSEPLVADSIVIHPAQRHSFILDANQPVGNYWIRANPNVGKPGFEGGINSAILRYKGAKEEEPTTEQDDIVNPFKEAKMVPLVDPAAPGTPEIGAADVSLHLNLGFNDTLKKFTINDVPFIPPTVPVLLQILSGAKTTADLLPKGSVYLLPRNKTVEISFTPGNAPGAPHPFHMHGHTFSVVRGEGANGTSNFVNPPRRDVVSTGLPGDNVTIRFTTDNPGPWFLHCHIDFHARSGLDIVLAEDTEELDAVTETPPTEWSELCSTFEAAEALNGKNQSLAAAASTSGSRGIYLGLHGRLQQIVLSAFLLLASSWCFL